MDRGGVTLTAEHSLPDSRTRGDEGAIISRLSRQLEFIAEIDKLKRVFRQTFLLDASRQENDAEHSWHLCMMAVILAEYSASDIDLPRVMKMCLLHDVVEIDAGDTFCYDDEGAKSKGARERAAADRIFAILPEDQACDFRALWEEFEARETPASRFAAALDRLQPLLHNYLTGGIAWQKHGVTAEKVRERNSHMHDGSSVLWQYAEELIRDAVRRGYLAP